RLRQGRGRPGHGHRDRHECEDRCGGQGPPQGLRLPVRQLRICHMAKKSSIEKNKRREKLSAAYAGRRERLKAVAKDSSLPMEERFEARLKLAELPRNASPTRVRNRCELSGRPRAVYRRFKLSRIALR